MGITSVLALQVDLEMYEDATGGRASTLDSISHLGCFWRLEVRMHMLIALHRPRVGNVQKKPPSWSMGSGWGGVAIGRDGVGTNLLRVHLELADDLDGDFAPLAGGVSCAVHVAEGAITHLLDERPSVETGILGQLALGGTLLCNDAFEDLGVDLRLLGFALLLVASRARRRIASLGSDVAVVACASTY